MRLLYLGAAAFWGLAGFFAPKDMEDRLFPMPLRSFDINGRVIRPRLEERRLPVAFDKIPKHLQQVYAIEDKQILWTRYRLRGTARALWTNLRGGEVQGGSTIYLGQNAFSQERTIPAR